MNELGHHIASGVIEIVRPNQAICARGPFIDVILAMHRLGCSILQVIHPISHSADLKYCMRAILKISALLEEPSGTFPRASAFVISVKKGRMGTSRLAVSWQ